MTSTRGRNSLTKNNRDELAHKRLQFIKKRHRELILNLQYDLAADVPVSPIDALDEPVSNDGCKGMRDIRRGEASKL